MEIVNSVLKPLFLCDFRRLLIRSTRFPLDDERSSRNHAIRSYQLASRNFMLANRTN